MWRNIKDLKERLIGSGAFLSVFAYYFTARPAAGLWENVGEVFAGSSSFFAFAGSFACMAIGSATVTSKPALKSLAFFGVKVTQFLPEASMSMARDSSSGGILFAAVAA